MIKARNKTMITPNFYMAITKKNTRVQTQPRRKLNVQVMTDNFLLPSEWSCIYNTPY